jgi:hypothetical protein
MCTHRPIQQGLIALHNCYWNLKAKQIALSVDHVRECAGLVNNGSLVKIKSFGDGIVRVDMQPLFCRRTLSLSVNQSPHNRRIANARHGLV